MEKSSSVQRGLRVPLELDKIIDKSRWKNKRTWTEEVIERLKQAYGVTEK